MVLEPNAAIPPSAPAAPAATPAIPQVTPPASTAQVGEPQATCDKGATDRVVPLTALQEERERRQALQAELELLRQQQTMYQQPMPVQQPQQPDNSFIKELDHLWETDPRKAVQAELMTALMWYDNVNATVDAMEEDCSKRYTDFNEYRPEIRKLMRTIPPEQRVQRGVMDLAYRAIKGGKVDAIVGREREAILAKIRAGEAVAPLSPGAVTAPATPSNVVILTEDEKKICDMMNITPADYVKNRQPGR